MIVSLGIAIKRAVDTAKRNKKECKRVEGTVGHVCGLMQMLSMSEPHVAMLQHPCIAGALDNVVDTLEEALELVTKCQKKNSLMKFVTATGTARKLQRVQEELLRKVSLCTLTVTTMSAVSMTNYRPQFN